MLSIVLSALSLAVFAGGPFRTVVSLNGSWSFIADPQQNGLSEHWNLQLPETAQQVTVPHTWNLMPGLEHYGGLGWYQKKFSVPAGWRNKHVRLRFAAVYHDAVVYLNGKKLTEHLNSGYTTFYVDISDDLDFGSENTLVVSVDNRYSDTNFPYRNVFDWSKDGGIIRDVDLQISGRPSIRYVHVNPSVNFTDTSATASIKIRLWEDDIQQQKFRISITERKTGKLVFSRDLSIKKSGAGFLCKASFKKVHLWHFDDPFLYEIKVSTPADEQISRFGFRKVAIGGTKMLVNNEPVRLPGIEYMPSSHPDFGSAEPRWVMDSVINMLKDLNATITRFHWQVDEHMLDLMDEKGILVQCEIPWWQQPAKLNRAQMQTARMQLQEMIERDFNHPSVFAWGISNEVIAGTDSLQYRQLKSFVKELDDSRMANVVSNETFKRQLKDESLIGDLPTWNEYIGTWFGKSSGELPQYFKKIESFLGNRPLLITENGLCEPRFSGGDLRRTQDMIYHFSEWAKRDYIAGCIYFCLNDYRTDKGEDGAGRFKSRVHGVTDLYFNKKPSYFVFKQLASPVEIVNVRKINDKKLIAELRNKNTLPSYSLRKYCIRWKTSEGNWESKLLPVLKPGEQANIELDDMEKRFAFEVLSPVGSVVTAYPLK